jgi:hypothetical protein
MSSLQAFLGWEFLEVRNLKLQGLDVLLETSLSLLLASGYGFFVANF